MYRRLRLLPFAILAVIALAACNLPGMTTPNTPDIGFISTSAAETVAAQLTAAAQGTPLPSPTDMFNQQPTGEATQVVPSATTAPTNTPAPTATQAPTNTPLPTATPTKVPTPTATPVPCYLGTFIKDVTIPDWADLEAGWDFTKTWRIRNDGTCKWTRDFSLVFDRGDKMEGLAVSLPEEVDPGETIDLSVDLVAPSATGSYKGFWMLKAANGTKFGVGQDGLVAFWVAIDVIVPSDGSVYNFATNFCTAQWETALNDDLDCPGVTTDRNGFVVRLKDPRLETIQEDEQAIWTNPDSGFNGWISGTFPKFKVQKGDHFKASIGCLYGAPKCDVTFQLQYLTNSPVVITIDDWNEVYDGKITEIDIDLSPLAGNEIQFVLTVITNGDAADDAAFWLNPRIVR